MNLDNRVALVTGSGRGIGRAIALKLAESGADLVINDFGDPAPAVIVAEEIKKLGRRAEVIMADVSQSAEVNRMVAEALEKFGQIDILVNNAGIARDQLVLKMTDEDWDRVLDVNLKSVFLCTRAVMRAMIKQRRGRIISIASVSGLLGNPGQANYAAAKAGILGFTRTVAKELASRGITANAVAPGLIDAGLGQALKEEYREEMRKHIPLGFLGTPQDVAEAVVFLAGDGARYITGQVLNVDGGMVVSW
ncbi:MAG: 3-oxoacyl-[acyl-carrier-protein] reductase [Dehalococcoidia bacterium]|jgi:3-oxoacyl-[acyl-carrier protein] reductase|nr:MAG: 3-oxoacyl-[acyl-carrier-protein] reductase [Dehalococcoidia bacterium]